MKKKVNVTIKIEVEIDETKFDEKFMEEFREIYYNFYDIEDHIEHLAQLYARGLICNNSFIDGYGDSEEMGIEFDQYEVNTEIIN